MNSDIYKNGCEFYKWYYYPHWDLYVMKIDGIPQLSNIMGGTNHTMIGIKLRKGDHWEVALRLNASEYHAHPLNSGQKSAITRTLKKFSENRGMFDQFYGALIKRIFN